MDMINQGYVQHVAELFTQLFPGTGNYFFPDGNVFQGNILYQRLKFAVGLRTGKEEGLIDYFIGNQFTNLLFEADSSSHYDFFPAIFIQHHRHIIVENLVYLHIPILLTVLKF